MSNIPLEEHTMFLDFQVMTMNRANLVLGREWFHGLCPFLKWSYKHNSFMFVDNETHVLLLGEKNEPTSPLICTAKVDSLSIEINNMSYNTQQADNHCQCFFLTGRDGERGCT